LRGGGRRQRVRRHAQGLCDRDATGERRYNQKIPGVHEINLLIDCTGAWLRSG
jgi:hypothetical protein